MNICIYMRTDADIYFTAAHIISSNMEGMPATLNMFFIEFTSLDHVRSILNINIFTFHCYLFDGSQ